MASSIPTLEEVKHSLKENHDYIHRLLRAIDATKRYRDYRHSIGKKCWLDQMLATEPTRAITQEK